MKKNKYLLGSLIFSIFVLAIYLISIKFSTNNNNPTYAIPSEVPSNLPTAVDTTPAKKAQSNIKNENTASSEKLAEKSPPKKVNYVENYVQKFFDKKETSVITNFLIEKLDDKTLRRFADRMNFYLDESQPLKVQLNTKLTEYLSESLKMAMLENMTSEEVERLIAIKENSEWKQIETKSSEILENMDEITKFSQEFDQKKYPPARLETIQNAILDSGDLENARMLIESSGIEYNESFDGLIQEQILKQFIYLTNGLDDAALNQYLSQYSDPAIVKEKKIAIEVFKSSIFENLGLEE